MHLISEINQRLKELTQSLTEAEKKKKIFLPTAVRKRVNDELHPLTTKYWPKIPNDKIFSILDKHGVVPVDDDFRPWSGLLLGREGKADILISQKGTEDAEGAFHPYENSMLSLSWYKMPESGNYEVNARLT